MAKTAKVSELETIEPDFVPPADLGAVADLLYKLEKELEAAQAKALRVQAPLKEKIKILEEHLIKELPMSQAEGIVGKTARAIINSQDIPTLEDWDLFCRHLVKSKDFALIHKKVATKHAGALLADKKKIPGVTIFVKKTVSCTKR